MELSDYAALGYGLVGLVVFVLIFRFCWAVELNEEARDPRYEKETASSAAVASVVAVVWPIVVVFFILQGFLYLITVE